MRNKKRTTKLFPAILVVGIVVLVLIFISPFVMLLMEDSILKKELNNPHINSDFAEWKEERISGFGQFKIPNEWSFQQDNEVLCVMDTTGQILAYGTVFAVADAPFESWSEFLSAILADTPKEIKTEPIDQFVSINGSSYGVLTVDGEESLRYFYLTLRGEDDSKLLLVFREDGAVLCDNLLEIAQAISYSLT